MNSKTLSIVGIAAVVAVFAVTPFVVAHEAQAFGFGFHRGFGFGFHRGFGFGGFGGFGGWGGCGGCGGCGGWW